MKSKAILSFLKEPQMLIRFGLILCFVFISLVFKERLKASQLQLRELREKKQLEPKTYRKIYKLVKGGMFRSRSHLMIYLKDKKMIKKVAK